MPSARRTRLEQIRERIQLALDATRRLESNPPLPKSSRDGRIDDMRSQISKLRKVLRNAEKAARNANMEKELAVKAKEETEKELAKLRFHAVETANGRGRKGREVSNSDYNEEDNEYEIMSKNPPRDITRAKTTLSLAALFLGDNRDGITLVRMLFLFVFLSIFMLKKYRSSSTHYSLT